MVLLDDKVYKETINIIRGKKELSLIGKDLANWLFQKYSVEMLNFQFNKLDHFDVDKYRLYIILKSNNDLNKMHIDILSPNPNYQNQIKTEFSRLAQKHNYIDTSKLHNLLVVFNDFSSEAKTDANWKVYSKARKLIKKRYSEVWHVEAEFESVVVFYYKDIDITVNDEKGISDKIKMDYYNLLKKYDEFGYYTYENFKMTFDSKENLDNNYEGNLFYYSRR